MPFGCIDIADAAGTSPSFLTVTRNSDVGCEGFYLSQDGYALNRDYMVPAYNMSDYYQIFPTWSDGANVAGYRRDKVSPVSFLPAARLAHYRTWTYGPPDFEFKASHVSKRLVIIFNWDFSPRATGVSGGNITQQELQVSTVAVVGYGGFSSWLPSRAMPHCPALNLCRAGQIMLLIASIEHRSEA
jgi:hypothetical protein